jgi:hypothetical protein
MKIAVSGSHHTGKTSLVEILSAALPAYSVVAEPYAQLEDEGHVFPEMPSLEDFEQQLQRSIECINENTADCLFDRCPLDLLAYLITHEESDRFVLDQVFDDVDRALRQIDLVVFVPIETPDRVGIGASEDADLRQRVDQELRDITLADRWGLGVEAIEVTGSLRERAAQVLAALDVRPGDPS